ncbi:MAG: hypothetical protein AAF805_02065 [Planctomycetota bacterium]
MSDVTSFEADLRERLTEQSIDVVGVSHRFARSLVVSIDTPTGVRTVYVDKPRRGVSHGEALCRGVNLVRKQARLSGCRLPHSHEGGEA